MKLKRASLSESQRSNSKEKLLEEFSKEQEILKAVLDSTADGILVTDNNENVIYYNKLFLKIWDISSSLVERTVGKELTNIVSDKLESPDEFIADLEKIAEKKEENLDFIEFKDGKVLERFFRPLIIKDEICGRVWSFRDITEAKKIREELEIKEQVIDNSLNGIIYTDIEGEVIYANDSFLKMWGYDELNQIFGQDIFELGILNNQETIIEKLDSIYNKGYWMGETTAWRRDGEEFEALLFANAIKDNLNNIIGCSVSVIDISEMKNAQRELKKSQEKYQKLIELLPEGISISDKKKFLFVNKAWLNLSGFENVKDVIGKDLSDFSSIFPKNHEIIKKRQKAVIEEGKVVPFLEHKMIRKSDNKVLNVEVAGIPILYDNKIAMMSVLRDISERKKFEKELKKSKELYQLLMKLLPDAVLVYKKEKLIFVNEKVLELTDYGNVEDVIGTKFGDLINIHPDDQNFVQKKEKKFLAKENGIGFIEYRYVRNDGSIIDIEVGAVSFRHDGERYIITLARDIRERKKTERYKQTIIEKQMKLKKIEEHNKLKTNFFANISHELKTPLNIILCALQLLDGVYDQQNLIDADSTLKYRRMMKQNCYRLLRILNNLIDITKLDAEFLKMSFANYNIINVVEEMTLSVAQYAKTKDIDLIFDTEVEEKIIACDLDKMERVLLNLLSNAIKFTDAGGFIYVNIYDRVDHILISIKDTGIGIPEDKLDEIFMRFKQVDESLSRNQEGSGIGLSLVKELVERHQGSISVKSEYGRGAEFIIKLPVRLIKEHDSSLKKDSHSLKPSIVERINIEFSDIYSIDLN
ncbi:PAS domain S-box-containing protein [Orenia metallireducens]|uniref:histidine kinase n=1 Tax=Orenia metallireducens TaxID=1413210 RepID=A0A285H3H9_9FIRM|nr:PAS domain-containing sensor histidine kinase [Orenia metallireducens]PRX29479.1 PAS domain S-box-containing protein [Orenia metallireducens]SNY30124.1 PAS domain S-box-containing protein [Orenia metallireducens]